MSLCTSVTTRFIRYLRVTSVNGLALQNESVYLSGCWDQSLSDWVISVNGRLCTTSLYNSLWLLSSIDIWVSNLSKWPSSVKWVRVPQVVAGINRYLRVSSLWLLSSIGIWMMSVTWMACLFSRGLCASVFQYCVDQYLGKVLSKWPCPWICVPQWVVTSINRYLGVI